MKWTNIKILILLSCAFVLFQFHVEAQTNEIRGLWVDAFHPGFKSPQEVQQLLRDARAAHFNTLFVEVRKRGDAYYQSRIEPAAADLPSGFDPLAEIISQAHSGIPRIEIHAWIVMYPVWNGANSKTAPTNHLFIKHPEWLTTNREGNKYADGTCQLDPGHPGAQRHLFNVAMDLVSRYEIDGLHLDHIRYPGNDWGYNPLAVKRFNLQYRRSGLPAPHDPQWLQFRRDQVTELVRKIYISAAAIKPALKISAATFTGLPSMERTEDWPQSNAYSSVLQDWRGWMEEGILDLNIPMVYFRQETNGNDIVHWKYFIINHRYGHQAAIGLGFYLNSTSNNLVHLQSVRSADALGFHADGWGCYSYAAMSTNGGFQDFMTLPAQGAGGVTNQMPAFETDATIPNMPWKDAPHSGCLKGFVVDAVSKAGLDHASLTLIGPNNRTLASDATGFFGAVNLPRGEYRLKVSLWNKKTETTLLSVVPGKVATVNFLLAPAAEAAKSKKNEISKQNQATPNSPLRKSSAKKGG